MVAHHNIGSPGSARPLVIPRRRTPSPRSTRRYIVGSAAPHGWVGPGVRIGEERNQANDEWRTSDLPAARGAAATAPARDATAVRGGQRRPGRRGGQPETNLLARRTAALTTAMAALRYARDIVQDVAGDLDGQAQLLVGQLLAELPAAADVDLVEVDRLRRF